MGQVATQWPRRWLEFFRNGIQAMTPGEALEIVVNRRDVGEVTLTGILGTEPLHIVAASEDLIIAASSDTGQPELNRILSGGTGRYFIVDAKTGHLLHLLPTSDSVTAPGLAVPRNVEQEPLNTIHVTDDWLLYYSKGRLKAWQLVAGTLEERWEVSDSNPAQTIATTARGHWQLQLRSGTEIRDRHSGEVLVHINETPLLHGHWALFGGQRSAMPCRHASRRGPVGT